MLVNALLEACAGLLQGAKDHDPFITALLPFCPTVYLLVSKARHSSLCLSLSFILSGARVSA
jgi:hypothetical protein